MFNKLSISTKIIGTIAVVLALSVLVAVIAITRLAMVSAVAGDVGEVLMPRVAALAKIRTSVDTYRRSELQFYLKNTDAEFEKYHTRMGKMQEEMKAAKEQVAKLNLSAEEKKQLDVFDAAWNAYVGSAQQVLTLLKSGKAEEAQQQTRGEGKKLYDQVNLLLQEMQDASQKKAAVEVQGAHAMANRARIWVLGLLAASLIIGSIFALAALRSVLGPLKRLARDAEQVATGDLSVVVDIESHDEIGQLAQAFEKMVNNLRELIGRLADSSSELSQSSAGMQANASQMANGAEEVAGQATTVATASEEMSATSGDIAQNCVMAAESARRAIDAAAHGVSVVESSISVMHRIADRVKASATTVEELGAKSDQIGSIISTIEDIADQTNLLALNAAIEAARAGEQGRGFAVVADEVRALAERTTKATKEIGNMIKVIQLNTKSAVAAMEQGVAEVETGTGEAARSGEALRNIQEEINSVNMQVQQIATAAEEQTATTSEISGNIQQINTVAFGTVEQARTTFDAAQHLARLADELQKVVAQFRLSESGKFIEWSRSFSVQVSKMDQEHQRLIDLINKLYTAMREGRGKEAIGSVLDELIEYTKTHFAHEEQLMRESGYAGYDDQKRAHEALINQVMETKQKLAAGAVLSQEVMSFLKSWLVNHIQGMDKNYGPVMNKKGIK
jgi:hemerythrin-like metal-binding protein